MEKIIKISNIKRENQELYGEYARYKVDVDYEKDGKKLKKVDYLDDKQTEKDVDLYINGLKNIKWSFFRSHLKTRIIYNLFMISVLLAGFFTVSGVFHILENVGVDSLITSIIGYGTMVPLFTYAMSYVNKDIVYYNKDELRILKEIKEELSKSEDIKALMYKLKLDGKTFDDSYERLKREYGSLRERNQERNENLQRQFKKEGEKRDEKLGLDYYEVEIPEEVIQKRNEYKKKETNNSSLKETLIELRKQLLEEKENKYLDNSFERSRKRKK